MALLPIKDDTPLKSISFQYVTVVLIVACIGVFLWQFSLGDERIRANVAYGVMPAVLFGNQEFNPVLFPIPATATLLTYNFLHGGWLHLALNMLFLWVFGNNVEDAMGHLRYIVFYMLCGVLAGLAHAVMDPNSIAPLVGASGAISGVLGAYLVLHPKSRLLVLFMNIIPLRLPAVVVLASWIGLQFLSLNSGEESNTAWWAHIGGFLAGMILVVPFRRKAIPLFDGKGRFGPDNPNVIELGERRQARSVLPTTTGQKPGYDQPLTLIKPPDKPGDKPGS